MGETEFESLITALRHYEVPDRKVEITTILWADNKEFILKLQGLQRKMSWQQSYRKIQREPIWKRPRQLILEYYQGWTGMFEWDGTDVVRCRHCGIVLTKSFTMHHSAYNNANYLNPLYIEILCNPCHARHHRGDVK